MRVVVKFALDVNQLCLKRLESRLDMSAALQDLYPEFVNPIRHHCHKRDVSIPAFPTFKVAASRPKACSGELPHPRSLVCNASAR
jgi:hypothetical protein